MHHKKVSTGFHRYLHAYRRCVIPWLRIEYFSGRRDKTRNSGICTPCNPPPRFYCPQPCILHMLLMTRCVCPPAIVCNDPDDVCTILNIPREELSIDAFITDRRRDVVAAGL